MFEIPATSAFVLSFANQDIYRGAAARTLLSSVDLSAADPIRAQFEDIHDEITMEILNRKYGVAQCCRKYLDENPTAQVIHLGGGLDPLPIDLAESYPKAHFFDVDMANMSLKEEINQKIGGPDVSFLTANLADIPSLTGILSNAGWIRMPPRYSYRKGFHITFLRKFTDTHWLRFKPPVAVSYLSIRYQTTFWSVCQRRKSSLISSSVSLLF